jgi:predicted amidophosphoribosyltransferase
MAELVSPCCGTEYSDDHIPRSICCGAEQKEDSDLCSNCLEHTDFPQYMCEICHEDFEEPEVDYEYEERMKESIAEDRMDEARDMGE